MIKYIEINAGNVKTAIDIHKKIFKNYDASNNYIESVKKVTNNKYYIIRDEEIQKNIGISGIYSLEDDRESAWLGWFGILDEYRKKGYGSKALKIFEECAIKDGFKYCRFYTDEEDNDAAIKFYEKNGYKFEKYCNYDDPASLDYKILIGSKTICSAPFISWNNRNIDLTSQIFKQIDVKIKKLSLHYVEDVLKIYEECFLDNHYFIRQFEGRDLKTIMETSFKNIFKYCLGKNYSYGIFDGDKLIAFSLCFDFYETKKHDINQFNNIFTSDCMNYDYPYKHEFHDEVDNLNKPIMYILAVAVDEKYRRHGYATLLINKIITDYPNHTIVSDVTSEELIHSFLKKKFKIKEIDENYYLVYRENER